MADVPCCLVRIFLISSFLSLYLLIHTEVTKIIKVHIIKYILNYSVDRFSAFVGFEYKIDQLINILLKVSISGTNLHKKKELYNYFTIFL